MSGTGYETIDHETAWRLMNEDPEIKVIDVRHPDEYDQGHWPGALNVVMEMMDEEYVTSFMPEKDATYIIYCRTGRRSRLSCEYLSKELGYTHLLEAGGITDWPYKIEKVGFMSK